MSRKLHEKCRNYRNIAPKSAAPLLLPSLYISRSVSSANFAKKCVHSQHRSSEVWFFDIFQKWDKSKCHQNYANEPCFPHLLTYGSSKHQHIYVQSTRNTVPHYPHEFHNSSRLRFLIRPDKRQNIDDKADQKKLRRP